VISWSVSDIAGVHLGDSHITISRLSARKAAKPTLTHTGWAPYDPSASEKDIAKVLKDLWHSSRMPTKLVNASLRSSGTVMRYFKIPSMVGPELEAALTLQAEEALQLSRDQVAVDWHIQSEPGKSSSLSGAMCEGVLFAAPAKDIMRQLSILTMAGLDPVILDVRAMAVANLHALLEDKGSETVCVVNVAPHSADVVILSKTGGIYPYTVFCRASTWAESPSFLCENIRDVMRYAEFKLDWDPARKVFLTGDILATGDFLAAIREGMKVPVDTWNPLSRMNLKSGRVKQLLDSNPDSAAMLVPSLGLALRRV
jgi:Tfp pilus assembly PilM family ATPase